MKTEVEIYRERLEYIANYPFKTIEELSKTHFTSRSAFEVASAGDAIVKAIQEVCKQTLIDGQNAKTQN